MLVVKIDVEKKGANLLAVIEALAEYDIISATWEDGAEQPEAANPKPVIVPKEGNDLASTLSSTLDRITRGPK